MAKRIWNFICRLSLVAAFVLAFFAVIFNVNLLSYADSLNPVSHARAATIEPLSFVLSSPSGLTLLVVILVLVFVSFFGPPSPRNKH